MSHKKVTRRTVFSLVVFALLLALGVKYIPSLERIMYPYPHRGIIEKYALEYGVDPLLVVSVIREESKFMPRSQSHQGAIGLMQLMPDTAMEVAQSLGDDFVQDDLTNPEKNIQYGVKYLSVLEKEFSHNVVLVLAAYNGGQGHVKEWLSTEQLVLEDLRLDNIPFTETRNYVERVMKSYAKYQSLYGV